MDTALYNSPSSIVVFKYNVEVAQRERNKIVFVAINNSPSCQNLTITNYTSCVDNTNDNAEINADLIRIVYPPFDPTQVTALDL